MKNCNFFLLIWLATHFLLFLSFYLIRNQSNWHFLSTGTFNPDTIVEYIIKQAGMSCAQPQAEAVSLKQKAKSKILISTSSYQDLVICLAYIKERHEAYIKERHVCCLLHFPGSTHNQLWPKLASYFANLSPIPAKLGWVKIWEFSFCKSG